MEGGINIKMISNVNAMLKHANVTVQFWTKMNIKEHNPLTLTQVSLSFIVCLVGHGISMMVFALEIIFTRPMEDGIKEKSGRHRHLTWLK